MKRLLIVLLLFVFHNMLIAQMESPFVKWQEKMFKEDKKMKYDGESTFVFYYSDLDTIGEDLRDKKKERIESENKFTNSENELRFKYLNENFSYPFRIIYPSEASKSTDFKEYRYKVFMKTEDRSPLSSGGFTVGGGMKSYQVYIYDFKERKKKKIATPIGGFIDFYNVVDRVIKFIEKS